MAKTGFSLRCWNKFNKNEKTQEDFKISNKEITSINISGNKVSQRYYQSNIRSSKIKRKLQQTISLKSCNLSPSRSQAVYCQAVYCQAVLSQAVFCQAVLSQAVFFSCQAAHSQAVAKQSKRMKIWIFSTIIST